MREYRVFITAEDASGNSFDFEERVKYPNLSENCLAHAVSESDRERKAIQQVSGRMPHLRNIQAEWSIHA